jgi:hypothetical protein
MTPPYYEEMANGAYAIVLQTGVTARACSHIAAEWACRLGLTVKNRIEVVGESVWDCELDGRQYWLAWDDWFSEVSLEPQDADAARYVPAIGARLGIAPPPAAKPET